MPYGPPAEQGELEEWGRFDFLVFLSLSCTQLCDLCALTRQRLADALQISALEPLRIECRLDLLIALIGLYRFVLIALIRWEGVFGLAFRHECGLVRHQPIPSKGNSFMMSAISTTA